MFIQWITKVIRHFNYLELLYSIKKNILKIEMISAVIRNRSNLRLLHCKSKSFIKYSDIKMNNSCYKRKKQC